MDAEARPAEGRDEGEAGSISEPTPIEPPREDRRWFRRDLTPAWAATVCLLAGERPIECSTADIAYLGGRSAFTPAVIAATMPDATVTTWNPRPALAHEAWALRRLSGLDNLCVVASRHLPGSLRATAPERPDDRFDVVVVDGLLDVVGQLDRLQLVALLGDVLRPGGIVCVAFRVAAGWSEVAVAVHVLQAMVASAPLRAQEVLPRALALMKGLRDEGAEFFTDRPVVSTWLDEAAALPVDVLAADLDLGLRPLSHSQVTEAMGSVGLSFIGSADLTEGFGLDLPPATVELVESAATPILRETLRDLSRRATHRVDVFRAGSLPMSRAEQSAALGDLVLTGISAEEGLAGADVVWGDAARALIGGAIAVADLPGVSPDQQAGAVRHLMQAGVAHPVLSTDPAGAAVEAAARLTAAIGGASVPQDQRVFAAPVIASAVPEAAPSSVALRSRLGARR